MTDPECRTPDIARRSEAVDVLPKDGSSKYFLLVIREADSGVFWEGP